MDSLYNAKSIFLLILVISALPVELLSVGAAQEGAGGTSPLASHGASSEAIPHEDLKWRLWNSRETQLRGANIYQQAEFGRPWCGRIVASDFQSLKSAGANFVNLSIPGPFNVDPPYERNPVFDQELERIVELAARSRLFVVLAFRTAPGRGEEDITGEGTVRRDLFFSDSAQDQFVAMWTHVARMMRDRQHVVGYDLLVEPTWKKGDPLTQIQFRERWRNLARRTVVAIRAIDPAVPVLVELDDWAAPDSLDHWKPLYPPIHEPHEKIVYVVHQYSPYDYTHESEPFDKQFTRLREVFGKMRKFRDSHDVPLAVTEFGVKFSRPKSVRFLRSEYKSLEKLGVNHAIWIWEPKDDSCSGGSFDINVREARHVLGVVQDNWRNNRSQPELSRHD